MLGLNQFLVWSTLSCLILQHSPSIYGPACQLPSNLCLKRGPDASKKKALAFKKRPFLQTFSKDLQLASKKSEKEGKKHPELTMWGIVHV